MAFTFRNGEHHRSPSGCYNKVNWNIKELEAFTNNFIALEDGDENVNLTHIELIGEVTLNE